MLDLSQWLELEQFPDDESEAIDAEELLEEILSPIRDTTYEVLKQNSHIGHSPQHDGYYLK